MCVRYIRTRYDGLTSLCESSLADVVVGRVNVRHYHIQLLIAGHFATII